MEDYRTKEIIDKRGHRYFEVTAPVAMEGAGADPFLLGIGKTLIEKGALSQEGNLTYKIIDDRIVVVFRVTMVEADNVYLTIRRASNLFWGEVGEALKMNKIIKALASIDSPINGKEKNDGSRSSIKRAC